MNHSWGNPHWKDPVSLFHWSWAKLSWSENTWGCSTGSDGCSILSVNNSSSLIKYRFDFWPSASSLSAYPIFWHAEMSCCCLSDVLVNWWNLSILRLSCLVCNNLYYTAVCKDLVLCTSLTHTFLVQPTQAFSASWSLLANLSSPLSTNSIMHVSLRISFRLFVIPCFQLVS